MGAAGGIRLKTGISYSVRKGFPAILSRSIATARSAPFVVEKKFFRIPREMVPSSRAGPMGSPAASLSPTRAMPSSAAFMPRALSAACTTTVFFA